MQKQASSKPRPVGRPKMKEGQAMDRIVPIRFDAGDFALIERAAKKCKQSLSEWVRQTLRVEAEAVVLATTLHEAMKMILLEKPSHCATTSELSAAIAQRSLYRRGDGDFAGASQINARAKKYSHLFTFQDPHTIQLTGAPN